MEERHIERWQIMWVSFYYSFRFPSEVYIKNCDVYALDEIWKQRNYYRIVLGSESDSEELRSFRPVSHSFRLGSWDLMNSHLFFGLGSLETELYCLVLARSLFSETLFTLQPHKVKTMFISCTPSPRHRCCDILLTRRRVLNAGNACGGTDQGVRGFKY